MSTSRIEIARELRITEAGVDRYIRDGMPLTDFRTALDWIVANRQPQYGRNAHKGVSLARKLLREGISNTDTLAPDPCGDALAAVESVLAPLASAVLQEFGELGVRVAKLVEGLEDPGEARAFHFVERVVQLCVDLDADPIAPPPPPGPRQLYRDLTPQERAGGRGGWQAAVRDQF